MLAGFVAPDNGLFVLCPVLLLSIPGFYVLARRKQYWHLAISLSVGEIEELMQLAGPMMGGM